MELPAGCFDGPRARGAFVLRVVMEPPWAVRVADEAPLSAVAVLRGSAWVSGAGGAQPMSAGDVLLARGSAPYVVAGSPGAAPLAAVGAGQVCSGPDGRELPGRWNSGVRTWGNDPAGRDALLVGTFRSRGEVGRALTAALPEAVVVPDPDPQVLALLAREVERAGGEQAGVLDRLLDLLLIAAVRGWSAGRGALPGVVADPVVQRAARWLEADPAAPWTVPELARRSGVSRSALTRRFARAVGTTPGEHLAQRRLALAAELLGERDLTLAAVARRVGYSSPFSLSAAFKKRYGVSPQAYRQR
ncbi:AraC family transcriptional regulator [Kineococcus indalonis]|uniref:AraC family transcriptional regulator n=1 Tax=Kineococcus indalonis TaxID=2696566 RepID=UPI001411DF7E|nr:AraC family transcriptional regulator [Kineococcus indalonis]NAZ87083.1 helix-turn-helix domain-containing protein [Kineococcus indalonis]